MKMMGKVKSENRLLCKILGWLVVLGPICLILMALLASSFGIDSDQKWGLFRIGSLVVGLVLISVYLGLKIVAKVEIKIFSQPSSQDKQIPQTSIDLSPTHQALSEIQIQDQSAKQELGDGIPFEGEVPRGKRFRGFISALQGVYTYVFTSNRWLITVMVLVVVGFLYVGFVTVWHWTTWPSTSTYHSMLADAFLHGQLALLVEPSPLLEGIADPYSLSARPGIPFITDLSYFEGKYYMYWGPIPAAFSALSTLVTGRLVGDQYIVFFSVTSVFLFSVLCLLYLKDRFYPSLPGWLTFLSIGIVATVHPMLWVLNNPTVYEASIASAQAFLIGGLYFALPTLSGSRSRAWRLALAGLFWFLSLGSRLTVAGAVLVMFIAVVLRLRPWITKGTKRKNAMIGLVSLLLPLLIGAGALGLYNYLRFRDVFETGFRYALNPVDLNFMLNQGLVFNTNYLIPNILYYLLAPIRFISNFPFIRPLWGEMPAFSMFLSRFSIPHTHSIENATGLLFSLPTILFTVVPVLNSICGKQFSRSDPSGAFRQVERGSEERDYLSTASSLIAAGIFASIPTGLFFSISNRYFMDSTPLLALAAVMGIWLFYKSTRPYPIRKYLATLLILAIFVIATGIGFMLALSGAASRFDDLNPTLYTALVELFSR